MMTWTNYKPFNNGDYNTVWELARQIVDQYRRDYPTDSRGDDELIQEYGIPYLTRWLFTTNGVNNQIDLARPEWNEFMKLFIMNFLNMEICYQNPVAWKRLISKTMLEYQWYIEDAAQPLYAALKGAAATTTSTRTGTATGTTTGTTDDTTSDTTITTGSDSGKGSSTRNGTTKNDTEMTTMQTTTSETSSEGSGTSNTNSNTTSTDSSRVLTSDMPQSNVSAETVGNPDLQTWTYASAMQDNNSKHNGNDTSAVEQSNTQSSNDTTTGNGNSKGTTTGTTADTEEHTDSHSHQTDTTHTSTRKGTTGGTNNSTTEETATMENMSAFDLTREKYNFFAENMKKPLYNVLNICYKYFISTYPNEYRLGFLEWDAIDNITSKVKEVAQ